MDGLVQAVLRFDLPEWLICPGWVLAGTFIFVIVLLLTGGAVRGVAFRKRRMRRRLQQRLGDSGSRGQRHGATDTDNEP